MRVVADTNTLISALLWRGAPRDLLSAAEADRVELVTSTDLRRELHRVICRAKFRKRIVLQRVNLDELLEDLDARLTILDCPPLRKRVVVADPEDDAVLACAVAARAEVIVTGDTDLLDLGSFEGVPIVRVEVLLARLGLK